MKLRKYKADFVAQTKPEKKDGPSWLYPYNIAVLRIARFGVVIHRGFDEGFQVTTYISKTVKYGGKNEQTKKAT